MTEFTPMSVAGIAREVNSGKRSAVDVAQQALAAVAAYEAIQPAVWIDRLPVAKVLAAAAVVDARVEAGERPRLAGAPFAVKDNIDVAGRPTTAACPAFAYAPDETAPVVARLLAEGGVLIGKTNLDQFATGLVGARSPFGACRAVHNRTYISGGSSAGAAVAVAAGLVSFALGTDTAGSGRVPAGCNNIVGLKPAVGTLSTEGVVPSCPSLDCVSFLTLTVDDALTLYDVVRGKAPQACAAGPEANPLSVFATPREKDLEFFGDAGQAGLFFKAIDRLAQSGARRIEIDFAPFREVANLLYEGPWLAE